ncbi:MAG TPA: hypothetical protein VFF28_06670 [Candidatus Nanoarchaeia archaeon]|nr:hypothetical protein [Candidatus Nanoarchaeia archaeon]
MDDIQLPEDELLHKVIQLYVGDRPVLRIGDPLLRHYKILEIVLTELGITFDRINKKDIWVPKLSGDGYLVAGMGRCVYSDGQLVLTGDSEFYQKGIDIGHMEKCKQLRKDVRFMYIE